MESHNWIINYIANFYVILYINVKTEYRWHLLLDNMELSIIVEQKSDLLERESEEDTDREVAFEFGRDWASSLDISIWLSFSTFGMWFILIS